VDEEEIKIKTDDGIDASLAYLLTSGRRSLVSGIQNDIVVS